MAALTMYDLKNYVVSKDAEIYDNLASDTVLLLITHSNLVQKWPEIRISLHATVGDLKDKLHYHGGTGQHFQRLQVRDPNSKEVLCELNDESKKLGFYGVKSGQNIHILDEDPYSLSRNGGLEDVTLVEKYVMPDEVYDKKENSLRNYKRKMREKDPNWTFLKENRREEVDVERLKKLSEEKKISVGKRCEVSGGRRGEVKYVGEIKGLKEGIWIGVELDEPRGKNDGTVKGVKLWEGKKGFGVIVRPTKLEVGEEFVELGLEEEEESDDEYVP
eukprot:augustus_masked-scaffold_9-processed-gene-6.4-mRNA-1 protein AED:0.44 eAED:0.44 QI:0/-1/0/1/-1/1/1/0/273